jgi:hypothetical protein
MPTTLCAPVTEFELWPRIGRRDTAEKVLILKSKGPFPVDRFERHSHRRCPRPFALQLPSLSSGRTFEGEIRPKNDLSHKSKGPLFVDRFERHSHRRCPRPSAIHLPSLNSRHALEGKIRPKIEFSHMSKGPLLVDRFERHSHRRCPRPLRSSYRL